MKDLKKEKGLEIIIKKNGGKNASKMYEM